MSGAINDHSLESLFLHARDLLCVANLNGDFQDLNPSWTRVLGWPIDELMGMKMFDLVHPKDLENSQRSLVKLADGKNVATCENRYRSKFGEYVWLEWSFHADKEKPHIIYGVVRNITQRKNDELRAQNDIRLLEMAEQTAKVGHWRLDSQTGLLNWSQEVFHIFGRKQNTSFLSLDDFLDAFKSNDRKTIWFLIESTIQEGLDMECELTLVRPDKQERIVVIRGFCQRNNNNVINGMFGIIQDVTDERRHQADLKNKEELLTIAFKATSDGIWDWDLEKDEFWFSPQWKAQLGYQDTELENNLETWQNLIFEEDRDQANKAIQSVISGEIERLEQIDRYRHKLGHTLYILTRAYVLRDKTGKAVRMVGAHTDVTELKRLEQAKSEFTSVVSHELRTPITAIHGAIGLIKGHFGKALDDQVKQLVDVANNNSERLIMLVNDILDMEKLQSGRMDFDIIEIPLGEFLNQAVEDHVSYGHKFGVSLNYDGQSGELIVMADRGRLMQVMANLLSNAIKFSNDDGIVKIRAQQKGNMVGISVIDTGRGIPDHLQEKVFEKFIQADSSDQRHKGGTGLGLSICKTMVEQMNGTISLISKPNEGSTFTVNLPLKP